MTTLSSIPISEISHMKGHEDYISSYALLHASFKIYQFTRNNIVIVFYYLGSVVEFDKSLTFRVSDYVWAVTTVELYVPINPCSTTSICVSLVHFMTYEIYYFLLHIQTNLMIGITYHISRRSGGDIGCIVNFKPEISLMLVVAGPFHILWIEMPLTHSMVYT